MESPLSSCYELFIVKIQSMKRQQKNQNEGCYKKMYQSAENRKALIKCQKLLIWQQKDVSFSDLDSMSSLALTSSSLSAINRLANVCALEQQSSGQAWCASEHNFAATCIQDICYYGEDFR